MTQELTIKKIHLIVTLIIITVSVVSAFTMVSIQGQTNKIATEDNAAEIEDLKDKYVKDIGNLKERFEGSLKSSKNVEYNVKALCEKFNVGFIE